jgi:hypothetical protein
MDDLNVEGTTANGEDIDNTNFINGQNVNEESAAVDEPSFNKVEAESVATIDTNFINGQNVNEESAAVDGPGFTKVKAESVATIDDTNFINGQNMNEESAAVDGPSFNKVKAESVATIDDTNFINGQNVTVESGSDFANSQDVNGESLSVADVSIAIEDSDVGVERKEQRKETAAEYIADGLKSGEFISDEDNAKMETFKKVLTVHGKVRLNNSMKWGYIAVLILTVLIILIKIIASDGENIPYELFIILWGGFAANTIVQATAYKVNKYRYTLIAVATLEVLCAILFTILWILQLCSIID